MGQYLPETIESVLINIQPGDQYFVIDGGSSDDSVEIIRKFSPSLTGWISEKDTGYAHALAKGFGLCTGDCLCWINSGDFLLRGALDSARDAIVRTGADLIFGDDLNVDETGQVLFQCRAKVRSLNHMMLFGGWTLLQDSCFWRSSLYEAVGGINPSFKYAADFDLFLRMSSVGHCSYVPNVFSAFRQHSGQKSISGRQHYKSEREESRKIELSKLKIRPFRRFVLEKIYWFLVRWRHYIGQKFHYRWIRRGTQASKISVTVTGN
jgi:glycosyltransferase involved in cell wall biosynthesis